MRRLVLVFCVAGAASSVGCRSIGRFPGIDPTDYAYSYFNGTSTQVYQFTVPQVESATLEALADLGFTKIETTRDGEVVKIHAKTLDHRHAWLRLKPRNTMTFLSVRVGLEGDEEVSLALIQRVALNFGGAPRTIIPLEPTIERRRNPVRLPSFTVGMPTEGADPTPDSPRVFDDTIVPPPAPSSAVGPFATPPVPDVTP